MEDVEVQLLQATRPEVGDEVTVLWYGEEYMCKVTMVEDTRVKVHYKGHNAGHDQWVLLSKPPGGGALAVRRDLFREPSTEAYSNGPLVVDGFIIEEQVVEEAEEEEQSYLLSQDEKLECAVCGEMFSRGHFKPASKHWKEQHGLRKQGPYLNLDLLSLISAGYLK